MSTVSQRSFSGGELTPSLYARTDISKYLTSLRTCRNYMILKHGGARQRPGTRFIGEVKDSSKETRLIPFEFDSTDNYMLEFGDLYIRFIKNGAYIYEATQAITAITQADPGVVTITAHGYSNGEEVQIEDVVGMTELNGRNFRVNNVTANTFELQDLQGNDFDTSGLTAYVSGGTAKRIYEIASSYTEAVLFDINYVQNNDVLSLQESTFGERHLARTSDTSWAFTNRAYDDESDFISSLLSVSGGAGSASQWRVLGVDAEGREGNKNAFLAGADSVPSSGSPRTLSWPSDSDAIYWKLFRRDLGVKGSIDPWGLIGEITDNGGTNTFIDDGIVPDVDQGLPEDNWDVSATDSGNGFKAITYYQQRFIYGGDPEEPDAVFASAIGNYENFYNQYRTLTADGPLKFIAAGNKINPIRHLLDLNGLVIFTENSEMVAQGDAAGTLTPTDINLRTQSYHGSGKLAPIIIDNTALFVQARGSIVRDFQYSESVNGYSGNDLTIFSTHLFEGYTLVDWTFQKVQNSTVWAARSDGKLLGLTYLKEHEVLAWHRHDFEGGLVKSVEVIPGATEDRLYLIVERTINGVTKKYVEILTTPQIDDIEDVIRMDSAITIDGTNDTATTMTLSGGTTWAFDETLTLTASAAYFASSDVGDQIHITGSDGTIIRFDIEAFSSSTVVTGKPHKTVPVAMRNTAFTTWGKAIDTVTGLWHLEGENVSVFGDGFVNASPNNASYDAVTVTNGQVELDKHFVVIQVGLPYTADIETLDVDIVQGETARDKKHIVNSVSIFVEETRGLWVGAKPPSDDSVDPLEGLYEIKLRKNETMDEPVELKTEVVDVKIKAEWNSNGRVFIRQVDPVPSTILSIMPEGNFTFRG